MKINLHLFGGRGSNSGGSLRGGKKPSTEGNPNSSYTWFKNSRPFQKRWYDQNGLPKRDKDFTDHGNPKKHPRVPHYHDWKDGKRGKGYWIDSNGIKNYFK